MRKILVDFTLGKEHLAQLRNSCDECEVVLCADRGIFSEQLKDAEILITYLHPIPTEMIEGASRLRWIQALTAGVDMLPLDIIHRRGIIITSGRGIHRIYMAEYAIAAMIILARNLHHIFRNQIERKWDRSAPQGEIYGNTLGILGLGSIGREIAKKVSCLGMRVIGVKRTPGPVESVEEVHGFGGMNEVFSRSDYVINLLPDTAETRGVIDRSCFDLMKDTACFINMGRGATVNEKDLVDALRTRKIRGAACDVFATEPLPDDSPLWGLDNVILTPHVCGVSLTYMERAIPIVLRNLGAYLTGSGKMENVVDFATGY